MASKLRIIAYAILALITILQLKCIEGPPPPKTAIPSLKGPLNYKRWANLVVKVMPNRALRRKIRHLIPT
jgi:hypothetical protein